MYLSLSASQREAIRQIESGENVFITGPAGTGKSYLLQYLKQEYLTKGIHLTASTGVAAINIGGSTLHSWAGLGLGNLPLRELVNNLFSAKGTRLRNKLKRAKMLAIDEISMISSQTFDLLNGVLQNARESDLPFGGIQLIIFGDFLQLPPVVKFREELEFCFESQSWVDAKISTVHLTEIFRQENTELIGMLNNIRYGRVSREDVELLRSRYALPRDEGLIKPTILSTHNAQVDKTNHERLKFLPAQEKSYQATYEGTEDRVEFLRRNCIAQDKLILKRGAQVMMLKNTFAKEGIINGSVGIVKDFSPKKDYPIVEFSGGQLLTIAPEEWILQRFDEKTASVLTDAKMMQIPLSLAWAITVHKSQGMTLEKIECDLARSFAEGQIYVALSRVRSLEGLYIKSFNINTVRANPKVIKFYEEC